MSVTVVDTEDKVYEVLYDHINRSFHESKMVITIGHSYKGSAEGGCWHCVQAAEAALRGLTEIIEGKDEEPVLPAG